MLYPVLGCAREIRFMIKDRFQNGARVVQGKADSESEQTRQQKNLFHPRARMQFALRTTIEYSNRDRSC